MTTITRHEPETCGCRYVTTSTEGFEWDAQFTDRVVTCLRHAREAARAASESRRNGGSGIGDDELFELARALCASR